MMIRQFEFILYVENQEKSKNFYETLFDRKPSLDVPGMTEFTISDFLKIGIMPNKGIEKILLPVMPRPNSGTGIPRCELYLTIENLEENFEKMLQNGATLVKPITKMDWNDTVGYLSDYDGHIIALAQK